LRITLYDPETNEEKATFTRMFVPWKLLKAAVRLSQELKGNELSEADADALAGLVVEAFGNKFSIEDLNEGSDIGEMITVMNQIIGRASGAVAGNPPTPPGS
jgi:hypothetical protein